MKKSGFAKVRPSVLLRLKQLHEACVLQMEQRENLSLYNYQTMNLCQYLFKLSTVGMKNALTFTLCLSTLSCTSEGLSKWRSCFPEEESGRGGVWKISGAFGAVPGFLIALMFFAY